MVAADTTKVANAVLTLASVSLGRRPTAASAMACPNRWDAGERAVHGSYRGLLGSAGRGLGSGCRCLGL